MSFRTFFLFCFLSFFFAAASQTNIICTNPLAEQVMMGNYSPGNFTPSVVIDAPGAINSRIQSDISPDSLKSYLLQLQTYYNRNTGSDTVSHSRGIGAARRWAYSKFQDISFANNNRLLPFYLQFNQNICNSFQHKNICAVLPGADTSDKSIIIVEAHIDSRCESECDTGCLAEGMEDNGSGTALVIELARVMSGFTLDRSVVFMLTIGEEQGLYGADAMADYVQQKVIQVKAVFNNDIVGGIICGETSSAPSCPGLNDIDSTHVRIFTFGGFNSKHKQLARFTKLQYKENILPGAQVPMDIVIMTPEDRTNRGGDHIPFRQKNITALRLTSANEHGDVMIDTSYTDRQHSVRDILGADTNGDQIIDSFFVDFNYLARNSVINGTGIAMAALGPPTPSFTVDTVPGNRIRIEIQNEFLYTQYRVGIRTVTNDWDSVYFILGKMTDTISLCDTGTYYVSVATMDYQNTESLFSNEVIVKLMDSAGCVYTGIEEEEVWRNGIELLQNKPNPFDEVTAISVLVRGSFAAKNSYISITDMNGKEVVHLPVTLHEGMNEVLYKHGYHTTGVYFYTLFLDNKPLQTRRMFFAN